MDEHDEYVAPKWGGMTELAFKAMQNETQRYKDRNREQGRRMQRAKQKQKELGNSKWQALAK